MSDLRKAVAAIALSLTGLAGLVLFSFIEGRRDSMTVVETDQKIRQSGAPHSEQEPASLAFALARIQADSGEADSGSRAITSGQPPVSGPGQGSLRPSPAFDADYALPLKEQTLVSSSETPPDADGNFKRVQILRTSFQYPLIRIEERWNMESPSAPPKFVRRDLMVADHVMVSLADGRTREDLLREVEPLGFQLRLAAPSSNLYLLSFDGRDPAALPKAIEALERGEVVERPAPDRLAFQQ